MRIDNLRDSQAVRTRKQVKALGTRAPIGDSSITTPGKRLRVGAPGGGGYLQAGGALVWQGPVNFEGPFSNVGPFSNSGPFTNSGAFTNTGKLTQNGAADLNGPVKIAGAAEITGLATLKNDLQVDTGGSIKVGTGLTITPGGSYGGEIVAGGGGVLHLVAANVLASEYISADGLSIGALGGTILGDLNVFGTMSATTKLFRMPHPLDESKLLQHGSTESPVSGIEYSGRGVLDSSGELDIELPSYFEALAKQAGRLVFVSGVGRPYPVGADEIADGKFRVYGDPGRTFNWLVKAERVGADFPVELPAPDQDSSNSTQ